MAIMKDQCMMMRSTNDAINLMDALDISGESAVKPDLHTVERIGRKSEPNQCHSIQPAMVQPVSDHKATSFHRE
jgi:hypothetical protein